MLNMDQEFLPYWTLALRNGDAGQYRVSGGVGIVSSRLSVEGPLSKNKIFFYSWRSLSPIPDWALGITKQPSTNSKLSQFW